MLTSPRRIRAIADAHDPNPPILTARQIAMRARILTLAESIFADCGRDTINLTNLCIGIRVDRGTLRFHFPDLDALLIEILDNHLQNLSRVILEVPPNAPDLRAARRAAYLAFTRGPRGELTQAHRIFVRDRHALPEADRTPLSDIHCKIGKLLAGQAAAQILAMLDDPEMDAMQVRDAIARLPDLENPPSQPPARARPFRSAPHRGPTAQPATLPLSAMLLSATAPPPGIGQKFVWEPAFAPLRTTPGRQRSLAADLSPATFKLLGIPP
jgi:AcrR family transcriptional regulator